MNSDPTTRWRDQRQRHRRSGRHRSRSESARNEKGFSDWLRELSNGALPDLRVPIHGRVYDFHFSLLHAWRRKRT